jgi:hypothetical protein
MTTRNRHLLMLAMTAALAAPLVLAQDAKVTGKGVDAPAAQEATPRLPPPALPVPAATAPAPQRLNESAPPLPPEVEEAAMNPSRPPPAKAETAPPAADRVSIRQRSKWAQLDVNGDGRISGTEGQGDADFKANFEMMDADKDGFITNTEYSARAKAESNESEEEEEERDN